MRARKPSDPARLEVWFGDEARIGQKKPTRRRAPRGTRPWAALVMPWCNTQAMAQHLAAIPKEVEPGRHAALLLDRAGWHMSAHLVVPDTAANASRFGDITIVPLPPERPELNPRGNVWQFMRENWLSNRVFTSPDNLVDHCCAA